MSRPGRSGWHGRSANVRRLVRRLTSTWAHAGDTGLIPDAKTGVAGAINTHNDAAGSHAASQRVLNQDPNAGATTLGKLQVDPQGNAYTTEPDTEHGTAQDADFARFTHADYIGELSGEPNPLAQTLGTYYFLVVDHLLQVTAKQRFRAVCDGRTPIGPTCWLPARPIAAHEPTMPLHFRISSKTAMYSLTGIAATFASPPTSLPVSPSTPTMRQSGWPVSRKSLRLTLSSLNAAHFPPSLTTRRTLSISLTGIQWGGRADAVVDVGFSPSGVAGYSSGEISGVLGSVNVPSPLAELFGLGSAADYLIESAYWLNRADFDEFEAIYLNNVRYVLGDVFEVPGGGAFLRRIIDYPTGLATAQLNVNFERADASFLFQ